MWVTRGRRDTLLDLDTRTSRETGVGLFLSPACRNGVLDSGCSGFGLASVTCSRYVN